MSNQHILSAFDRDLDRIQEQILRLGGLVEVALRNAVEALETGDHDLSLAVREGDKEIDALEEEVRHECARVLALRAPAASDLRKVLSVLHIAPSLERCGDYAKNIAKRSIILEESKPVEGAAAALRRLSRLVEAMLSDALDAYVQRDLAKAEDVISRDFEADQMYNTLFRSLLTHMLEDPRTIAPCMHLHFIAKNIERVGDHATGIAEQAIYLMTGSMPDDERPKVGLPDGDEARD